MKNAKYKSLKPVFTARLVIAFKLNIQPACFKKVDRFSHITHLNSLIR